MQSLYQFIKQHHDGTSPLLLALSGGADSLALWSMLKEVQKSYPFLLHVAHIDHGWREESSLQAADLQKLVKDNFHLLRLEGVAHKESAAREARLAYFKKLQAELKVQAVIFAHHADDVGETVLKRVLEGAHISCLSGMRPISSFEGLTCWRPLLSYTKKEIAAFLVHEPFLDSTNEDTTYLRSRMRLEMLPFIEKSLGKNAAKNLVRLGERSAELSDYFAHRLEDYRERIVRSSLGVMLDFSGLDDKTHLEWEWLIKREIPQTTHIERVMTHLRRGDADYQIDEHFFVDRRRLFWLEEKRPRWQAEIFQERAPEKGGWKSAWSGDLSTALPSQDFSLVTGEPSMQVIGSHKKLGSLWSEYKVPIFLRSLVPVVMHEGFVLAEFLTGKPYQRGSVHLRVKLV